AADQPDDDVSDGIGALRDDTGKDPGEGGEPGPLHQARQGQSETPANKRGQARRQKMDATEEQSEAGEEWCNQLQRFSLRHCWYSCRLPRWCADGGRRALHQEGNAADALLSENGCLPVTRKLTTLHLPSWRYDSCDA